MGASPQPRIRRAEATGRHARRQHLLARAPACLPRCIKRRLLTCGLPLAWVERQRAYLIIRSIRPPDRPARSSHFEGELLPAWWGDLPGVAAASSSTPGTNREEPPFGLRGCRRCSPLGKAGDRGWLFTWLRAVPASSDDISVRSCDARGTRCGCSTAW